MRQCARENNEEFKRSWNLRQTGRFLSSRIGVVCRNAIGRVNRALASAITALVRRSRRVYVRGARIRLLANLNPQRPCKTDGHELRFSSLTDWRIINGCDVGCRYHYCCNFLCLHSCTSTYTWISVHAHRGFNYSISGLVEQSVMGITTLKVAMTAVVNYFAKNNYR